MADAGGAEPVKKKARKQQGGGLAAFGFKDARSGSVSSQGVWSKHGGTCLALRFPPPPPKPADGPVPIAAFDMDNTLIRTKSGKKFPQSHHDWQLLHDRVRPALQRAAAAGFRLAIITNQEGVSKGKLTEKELHEKIGAILDHIGLPMDVYAATVKDTYRKPRTGMWDLCVATVAAGGADGGQRVEVDLDRSVYVGDAAGRPEFKKAKFKKDFAGSDYKMALNAGVAFQTPEQYFAADGAAPPDHLLPPPPATLAAGPPPLPGGGADGPPPASSAADPTTVPALASEAQELVVLVGSPASGKSLFCARHLPTYVRINQDTLKTKAKCIKAANEALAAGKSAVIDNTNRNASVRREYVDLAKKHGVPARCVHMATPKDTAFHLAEFRALRPGDDQRRLADMVIHGFYKQLQPPAMTEGFSDVVTVDFVPSPPNDEASRKLFSQFLRS